MRADVFARLESKPGDLSRAIVRAALLFCASAGRMNSASSMTVAAIEHKRVLTMAILCNFHGHFCLRRIHFLASSVRR